MYDKFLSQQWIYDRCLEGTKSPLLLMLFIALIISFGFYWLVTRKGKIFNTVSFVVIGILSLTYFSSISFLFGGYIDLWFDNTPLAFLIILLPFISIAIALLFLMGLRVLYRKLVKQNKKILRIILVILSSFLFFPLVILLMLLGSFFVLNCSDLNQFFPAIDAAHQINTKLRSTKSLPKTIEELSQLNLEQYQIMTNNAKVNYIYDSKTNSYTWFVRPSKYYVAVFDSKSNFMIYNLNSSVEHIPASDFPPSYPGPWDKLPN